MTATVATVRIKPRIQLSQVLEDNKQQTIGIVNGVNAVRARAADEGGPVNGSFRQVNGELDGMRHNQHTLECEG